MKVQIVAKNKVDALQRVVQIFTRRGYELSSLHMETDGDSKKIIIEFPADEEISRTVMGQLEKIIDSVEVREVK